MHPIQQALALHRQGRLAAAEAAYRAILRRTPRHFDALHLLGVLAAQRGEAETAARLIGRAIALDGSRAAAHGNLGNALKQLGRLTAALASHDRAVALDPAQPDAQANRAVVLGLLGRHAAALAGFEAALALRSDHAEALNGRGCALRDLGRPAEALAGFDRAIALHPDHAEAHVNRGHVLLDLGQPAEAVAAYDAALRLRPGHAPTLGNRALALRAAGRPPAALACFDAALAGAPGDAALHNNRANLLHALERPEEALAGYRRAIALGKDSGGGAEPWHGCGNVLAELGRPGEALAAYDTALAARPDYAEAHWNRSLVRLLTGDFAQGFAEYEWRWARREAPPRRHGAIPLWLGQAPLAGQRILLHAEQGLGDTIQFCRYVPLVRALGATVTLEVQPPLRQLLAGLGGVVAPQEDEAVQPGDLDWQCPLMSLPLALGTRLETIPPPWSPLASEPPRQGGRRRIGLVASGNPGHRRDAQRSVPLRDFAPLLAAEAEFVRRPQECRTADAEFLAAEPRIADQRHRLRDFTDTAALIAGLDLVITVDTSVAHLAGSMGKPVWIILPEPPDWRWLLGRETSPWYPSARLFRGPQAIEAIAAALDAESMGEESILPPDPPFGPHHLSQDTRWHDGSTSAQYRI